MIGSRSRRTLCGVASVLAFSVALSGSASAQSNNQVAAESLFREARRLLDEGKYAEACEKLSQSQRLEPAIGTALNLGRCYEKTGQVASAWARYREAASLAKAAGQTERANAARQAADKLEASLPHLTIQPAQDSKPDKITRDGAAVSSDTWGISIPVDPGDHAVEATAAGKKKWTSTIAVAQKESKTLVVPALEDDPNAVAAAPAPAAANPTPVASLAANGEVPAVPVDNPPSGYWNAQRIIGVSLGVVGVAGVTFSVIEGLKSLDKKDKYESTCNGDCPNTAKLAEANAYLDDARSARTLSIVGGAVGGAALIGGIVLFATASSGKESASSFQLTPMAGLSTVGLRVRGAF